MYSHTAKLLLIYSKIFIFINFYGLFLLGINLIFIKFTCCCIVPEDHTPITMHETWYSNGISNDTSQVRYGTKWSY